MVQATDYLCRNHLEVLLSWPIRLPGAEGVMQVRPVCVAGHYVQGRLVLLLSTWSGNNTFWICDARRQGAIDEAYSVDVELPASALGKVLRP